MCNLTFCYHDKLTEKLDPALEQENPAVAREDACCSTGLQGHPRSMIFILSDKAYVTFY